MKPIARLAFVLVALGALAVPLALRGADAPTKTVDAGGLTFEAPATWKSSRPGNAMRRAQLTVEPAKGDTDPAELVVFAFPEGVGTVADNVRRWEGQFEDRDGRPARARTEKRKAKNVDVTFVSIAGHYVAPVAPGRAEKYDKSGYRLLGGIVEAPRGTYILKMVGPQNTMKEAEAAFDKLIASIQVQER